MRALYLASVWLHILAAIVWIGGIFFLVLVVVPWLKRGGRADAGMFLRETGQRFRNIGWLCFGVLLMTGSFNLRMRGVRFADLTRGELWDSPFGRALALKLGVFAVVLVVSAVHDFVIGPRATAAIAQDPRSQRTAKLRQRASWLGRANAVLALVLVAVAVVLVRGVPW